MTPLAYAFCQTLAAMARRRPSWVDVDTSSACCYAFTLDLMALGFLSQVVENSWRKQHSRRRKSGPALHSQRAQVRLLQSRGATCCPSNHIARPDLQHFNWASFMPGTDRRGIAAGADLGPATLQIGEFIAKKHGGQIPISSSPSPPAGACCD